MVRVAYSDRLAFSAVRSPMGSGTKNAEKITNMVYTEIKATEKIVIPGSRPMMGSPSAVPRSGELTVAAVVAAATVPAEPAAAELPAADPPAVEAADPDADAGLKPVGDCAAAAEVPPPLPVVCAIDVPDEVEPEESGALPVAPV